MRRSSVSGGRGEFERFALSADILSHADSTWTGSADLHAHPLFESGGGTGASAAAAAVDITASNPSLDTPGSSLRLSYRDSPFTDDESILRCFAEHSCSHRNAFTSSLPSGPKGCVSVTPIKGVRDFGIDLSLRWLQAQVIARCSPSKVDPLRALLDHP